MFGENDKDYREIVANYLNPHDRVPEPKKLTKLEALIEKRVKKHYKDSESRIKRVIVKLVTDIKTLKAEVEILKKRRCGVCADAVEAISVCPKVPFQTLEEFLEFDQKLAEDDALCHHLGRELSKHTDASGEKFVRSAWRCLITDCVAENFSWRGTEEKRSISELKVTSIIQNIIIEGKRGFDSDFVQGCKAFFQFAKHRRQYKEATRSKAALANSDHGRNEGGPPPKLMKKPLVLKVENLTPKVEEPDSSELLPATKPRPPKRSFTASFDRLMPLKPFATQEEVLKLESTLRGDTRLVDKLTAELIDYFAESGDKFVKGCWRALMPDNVAVRFSWRGTAEKMKVCDLLIAMAIKNAFIRHRHGTHEEFVKCCKSFFQFAKHRMTQRQLYAERTRIVFENGDEDDLVEEVDADLEEEWLMD